VRNDPIDHWDYLGGSQGGHASADSTGGGPNDEGFDSLAMTAMDMGLMSSGGDITTTTGGSSVAAQTFDTSNPQIGAVDASLNQNGAQVDSTGTDSSDASNTSNNSSVQGSVNAAAAPVAPTGDAIGGSVMDPVNADPNDVTAPQSTDDGTVYGLGNSGQYVPGGGAFQLPAFHVVIDGGPNTWPEPPDNIPGGPFKWSANPQNSRGGTAIPKNGGKSNLTWSGKSADDPNGYWKQNDGKGGTQRYLPDGTPIEPGQKPGSWPSSPSSPWWTQIFQFPYDIPIPILIAPPGYHPYHPGQPPPGT